LVKFISCLKYRMSQRGKKAAYKDDQHQNAHNPCLSTETVKTKLRCNLIMVSTDIVARTQVFRVFFSESLRKVTLLFWIETLYSERLSHF
jgi:hypothetical protein